MGIVLMNEGDRIPRRGTLHRSMTRASVYHIGMLHDLQSVGVLLVGSLLLFACGPPPMTKCGGRVSRTACSESAADPDLSGRWNETDARMVADEMIGEMLSAQWLEKWADEHEERPTVVVGPIRNQTMQHIDEEIFIKDIERYVVNSDSAQFVERADRRNVYSTRCGDPSIPERLDLEEARELGADFLVRGTIDSAVRDTLDGGKVSVFYTVNLELVSVEEGRKAWLGEKEIKKVADPQKSVSSPQSPSVRGERSVRRTTRG